jgi:hypothetical protein
MNAVTPTINCQRTGLLVFPGNFHGQADNPIIELLLCQSQLADVLPNPTLRKLLPVFSKRGTKGNV